MWLGGAGRSQAGAPAAQQDPQGPGEQEQPRPVADRGRSRRSQQDQAAGQAHVPAQPVGEGRVRQPAGEQVQCPPAVQVGQGQEVESAQQQVRPGQQVVSAEPGQQGGQRQVHRRPRQGAEDLHAVGQIPGVRPELRAESGQPQALRAHPRQGQGPQVPQLVAERRQQHQGQHIPRARQQCQGQHGPEAPGDRQPIGPPHSRWD